MRKILVTLCFLVLSPTSALAVEDCCNIVSVDQAKNAVVVREIATGKIKTLNISNAQLLGQLRPGMIFGPTAIAGIQTSPRNFEPNWAEDCCNFRIVHELRENAGTAKQPMVAEGQPQYTGTIGSVEIGPGVSVDNISITRLGSRSVRLKFDVSNTSGGDVKLSQFGMASYGELKDISLLDFDGGKRYTVVKDEKGICVCSSGAVVNKLGSGERRTYWAQFAAPPPSVTSLTFSIPGGVPIDGIPVSRMVPSSLPER